MHTLRAQILFAAAAITGATLQDSTLAAYTGYFAGVADMAPTTVDAATLTVPIWPGGAPGEHAGAIGPEE